MNRMSLSPFNSGTQQPSTHRNPSKNASDKENRLRLSQALLITAGLAGLVGLFCGVVIRFSLSSSSTASFLSPLQTFPALPDWTPELPQGTADAHYSPGGVETWPDADGSNRPFDSGFEQETNAGADRERAYRRDAGESFEGDFDNSDGTADRNYPNSSSVEESYPEAPYSEESYPEESYPEESYPEESYGEEPYPEASYSEPYPAEEAPMEEAPYSEGDF